MNIATRILFVLLITLTISISAGCGVDKKSERGFQLPDGNAELGQVVFLAKQCNACHQVSDLSLPKSETEGPVSIVLGGKVSRVKTYGELVSSIINPSHKLMANQDESAISVDGESLMPDVNSKISVQELIDLVAFLSEQYEVVVPDYQYRRYQYRM